MDNFHLIEKKANLIVDESIIEVQLFIDKLKSGNKEDLSDPTQW
jgi:hypothetical protein